MGGAGPVGSPFGVGTGPIGPAVTLAHPAANVPIRVSQGVSQGLLLAPIQATYPRIAITAGVSGTVVVNARIDRQGHVIGASAISGPPMLRQAAVEAVSAAKYRPFLLNGEPTEVFTTYTVTFRLGS